MESIEVKYNKVVAENAQLKAENAQLKEAISAGKKATAKAERAAALKESKLPEPCVNRIEQAFANSTDNAGLKEAINTEVDYVKSLGAPIKRHNGASDNGASLTEAEQAVVKVEGLKERQFNAYRKGGMSEADASRQSGFTPKK